MAENTITLQLGGSVELVLRPAPPAITPVVTARFGPFTATAKGTKMAYTLPVGFEVHVRVDYVDNAGNPATIDGLVAWDTSAASIATVQVDANDSHLALITPVGPVGNAQITATADADLGEGMRELITLLDISIVAGEAVAGTITPVGPAEPIP